VGIKTVFFSQKTDATFAAELKAMLAKNFGRSFGGKK
jgi:hypothetical protein